MRGPAPAWRRFLRLAAPVALGFLLTACGGGSLTAGRPAGTAVRLTRPSSPDRRRSTGATPTTTAPAPSTGGPAAGGAAAPLPTPASLVPFAGTTAAAGEGSWNPAGRPVAGTAAVEETSLVPPGGTQPAGIAWMDTRLLSAQLYSGSKSPGGGPYRYTAPVQPAQASTLVAAFNGGFYMNQAEGGYYTEGRTVVPLVTGAASLVIYADGSVDVGAWGTDVTMTPNVVAVRQNLVPLVAGGQPTPQAASSDWQAWGATCGATSCAPTVPGVEQQWRSGVGVTADGGLVYVTGPALAPLQLADLLVRAGAVRGMQLDINPDWTVFVTYDPPTPGGLATPSNGSKLVAATVQGPWTFFEPWWARDFVTMSARAEPTG